VATIHEDCGYLTGECQKHESQTGPNFIRKNVFAAVLVTKVLTFSKAKTKCCREISSLLKSHCPKSRNQTVQYINPSPACPMHSLRVRPYAAKPRAKAAVCYTSGNFVHRPFGGRCWT